MAETTTTITSGTGSFNMSSTLTEGTLVGGFLGAGLGLYIGYKRGMTLWFTTLVGLIGGSAISHLIISYKSKN